MMIATEALKATQALVDAVPLLGDSPSKKDYNNALALVEELMVENPSSPLLDIVCARISEYENQQPEFQALRAEMDAIPAGLAVLRTLMDQHHLTISDFPDEIGSKSMVSRVLNGERQLSVNHIRKLSSRFNVSPAAFI